MKIFFLTKIILIFCWSIISAQGSVNPKSHYVKPHMRRDGTFVKGHQRTNPNSTNRDNYSTRGNTNPWTGQAGWITPDKKPIPSYSVPSYSPPVYTPKAEYTVPSNINTSPRSQFTSDYPSTPTYSTTLPNNKVSTRYSNYSYDLSAGPRVIHYTNGRDEFNVVKTAKVVCKKGLTYFSFDVYNNKIEESIGSVEGQMLLNGGYKFYDAKGILRVSENYKNGLKHGHASEYDEYGKLSNKKEYYEGVVIYQKFTDEDDITFELYGDYKKYGSKLLISNKNGLYKKIEFLGGGRDHRVEYAPGTQNIIAEYSMLNQEFDGPFRSFKADGKTQVETLNYKNGKLEGEGRAYDENGRLSQKITYKAGEPHGPYEIFNKNNTLAQKGTMANGGLQGQLFTYDEKGVLQYEETYINSVLNGPFKVFRDKKTVVNGAYREGEKQGRWTYYWLDSSQYFPAEWYSYNNGILDGPFQEIKGDSVLTGTYKNGLLEGDFKVYQPLLLWLFGTPPQKVSTEDLLCSGQYSNGKKTGIWKCYDRTETLVEQGNYLSDLKHGEWRYYFSKYSNEQGIKLPYSGNLFLIENYLEGRKNGRSERLAYLIETPIQCDTSIGTVNPLDTCYSLEYQKVREITYYKNDILHGPLEWRDEAGTLKRKGEYRMGKMSGVWTVIAEDPQEQDKNYRYEVNYENDLLHGPFQKFDAASNFLLEQGAYFLDKKNGLWNDYYPDGKKRIASQVDYAHDKRNIAKEFSSNSNLFLISRYIDGNMTFLEQYDTIDNNIEYRFENILFQDGTYNFDLNIFIGDSTSRTHIIFESGLPKPEQDPFLFHAHFMFFINHAPDRIYANGPFSRKGKNGVLLEEGFIQKKERHGEWKYYFPNQNVIRHVQYKTGELIKEHYTELNSSKPFSGKMTLPSSDEGGYLSVSIKKGLRHGNTLKYDRQGTLIKKTKYKNGKKIEPKSD